MKAFHGFINLELKRFTSKRNIIILALFLLLALYFAQEGIEEYKHIIENKENFQEIEKDSLKKFINYNQYGNYGFRMLFVPSPLSIFFSNSGTVSGLTAFVDSGIRLRIYRPYIGKNLYAEKSGGFKDFFGIMLLVGSLMCLALGYDSLQNREYIKFLVSLGSHRRLFISVITARFLLFSLFFLVNTGCALFLVAMNGIALSSGELLQLLIYSMVMLLIYLVFFILGIIGGSFRSRYMGMVTLIVIWFGLLFLLPGAVTRILSKKANDIASAHNLEQKKLQVLSQFEKKALAEAQRYTSKKEQEESEKQLVESYWNEDFRTIQDYEKKMQVDMEENLQFFQRISLLTPTTFYFLVQDEISSKGYGNFFRFYQYIQQLQQEFVRFTLTNRYYSNFDKLEPFVKNNENIFYAGSRLPENFWIGLALTVLYICGLLYLSFFRFKKYLFALPEREDPDADRLDLRLNEGESVVLLTTAPSIINQLYDLFSGVNGRFRGRVRLNGKNLDAGKRPTKGEQFIYLCQPGEIPGSIKLEDFFDFLLQWVGVPKESGTGLKETLNLDKIGKKNLRQLGVDQIGRLLMEVARLKKSPLYMIHDFVKGAPMDFIVEFSSYLKEIKRGGSSVLYLTNDVLLASRIGDRVTYMMNDPSLPACLDIYTKLQI